MATRLYKASTYLSGFGDIVAAVKNFDVTATARKLAGQVDELATIKQRIDRAGSLDELARKNEMRLIPGLDNRAVRAGLEKAQELVFKAIDTAVDKVAGQSKTGTCQ
jgi:hypothetical protein